MAVSPEPSRGATVASMLDAVAARYPDGAHGMTGCQALGLLHDLKGRLRETLRISHHRISHHMAAPGEIEASLMSHPGVVGFVPK